MVCYDFGTRYELGEELVAYPGRSYLCTDKGFVQVATEGVKGVGPDAPMVTNENGGKQSHTPYRFDLLPTGALFDAAETLAQGAEKYGPRNWEKIPVHDHINHALQHVFAFLLGDTTDDHLPHAVVRLMFALDLHRRTK